MTEREEREEGERGTVVLPCGDLDATVSFFTGTLGFRIDTVSPADRPSVVELSGHGLHIRLQPGVPGGPGVLRLPAAASRVGDGGDAELTAPNGTRIELIVSGRPLEVPPLRASFAISRAGSDPGWHVGRAGMEYRDLIPDRQGGRFIASHIRIPEGGPVPDYVHFHRIRFQMIFCVKGWVRVVYEDQGPPFVLQRGDCVLQPPRIRHRVLECAPGLEVVEVSCPAEHETRVDHDLALPTMKVDPGRDFGGQRFVRHVASEAPWEGWRHEGFRARDTGIAAATAGLAGARVVQATGEGASSEPAVHQGEFQFLFVLNGGCRLDREGHQDARLNAGDAVVVPAGISHALATCSADLEFLEIRLPGNQAVADV